MIMGCNLIDGVAHARDLKYVDKLFKAYNPDQKVLETFHLGKSAGINATFMVNKAYPLFNKYRKAYSSKMKAIYQIELKPKDFFGDINRAIDNGADTMYIVGYESDKYVKDGRMDRLAKALDHIKKQGYLAIMGGIGPLGGAIAQPAMGAIFDAQTIASVPAGQIAEVLKSAAAAAITVLPGNFRKVPELQSKKGNKPDSNFGGVQVGTITYSWRSMPQDTEKILQYCIQTGISSIEWQGYAAEKFAGIPEIPGRPDPGTTLSEA
jgi:hypothetical protein